MSEEMKISERTTERGFRIIEFTDLYGAKSSLQASSLCEPEAVWLGVNDAEPKVMASQARSVGVSTSETCGWVPYPIPSQVALNTRMHLSREQVTQLLPYLQTFVDTGELALQARMSNDAKQAAGAVELPALDASKKIGNYIKGLQDRVEELQGYPIGPEQKLKMAAFMGVVSFQCSHQQATENAQVQLRDQMETNARQEQIIAQNGVEMLAMTNLIAKLKKETGTHVD